MKKIKIDIMRNDGRSFYKTLSYIFAPPVNVEALVDFIEQSLPSLCGKSYTIVYNDNFNGHTEPVWINIKNKKQIQKL